MIQEEGGDRDRRVYHPHVNNNNNIRIAPNQYSSLICRFFIPRR